MDTYPIRIYVNLRSLRAKLSNDVRKRGERKIPFISHFLLHAWLCSCCCTLHIIRRGRYLPTKILGTSTLVVVGGAHGITYFVYANRDFECRAGSGEIGGVDMRRCRLIFLSFILSPGFISIASSCSLFSCCSSLYQFTSFTTIDDSRGSEERARLPSDSEKYIVKGFIRGGSTTRKFQYAVDGKTSPASPSASNKMKKWDDREISTLGNDLVRGAKPQSSIDFYGHKLSEEYEYEHHSMYFVDALKDYLFAVLYSGLVLVTFMGILGHVTLSPLFDQ